MKKVQVIIFIIALVCFIGSGGYLAKYFYERHVSAENMDSVKGLLTIDENNDELVNIFAGGTPDEKKKIYELLIDLDPTRQSIYEGINRER